MINKETVDNQELEIVIDKAWDGIKNLPHNFKTALFSTFFFGLLAHFYAYTNLLLSYDSSNFYYQSYVYLFLATGRPIGIISGLINHYLYLPWALGFLTLFLIGISTWLILEILGIKRVSYIIFVSGVVVTFPVITSYNCFLFMAPQFVLGLLFACLSVYFFTSKVKHGAVYSFVLLGLSLGSYQSFLSVSASLMLLVLIGDILDKELNTKDIIFKGLRYCFIIVVSISIYYILWALGMKILGWEFLSYAGYDQMLIFKLSDIPNLILSTYKHFFGFFIQLGKYSYYPKYLGVIMLINIFIGLFCCFMIVLDDKKGESRSKLILLIIILLLLPFAINVMYFISKGFTTQTITMYSYLIPWFFLTLALERMRSCANSTFNAKIIRVYAGSLLILYTMSIYNGWVGANTAYVQLHANYESATSYITRIIYAIETTEGYQKGVQVAIIGTPSETEPRPGFRWTKELAGVWQYSTALTFDNIATIFARQIDTSIQFIRDSEIRHRDEFKNAPKYPDKGSIFWVDDTIVVKLSDPLE